MEDDEHDDLLRCSDEDSMTENEEQCLPSDKQGFLPSINDTVPVESKSGFIFVGTLTIISATFLVVLLPMYLETVNVKGDAYTLIQFVTTMTIAVLVTLLLLKRKFNPNREEVLILKAPIEWMKIYKLGLMYAISGFMVVYAVDRKRVMCHLQDPIKGIVLVFSLVYYFFFCRKMMGLQKIFSSTTIIVGLFISVDYGLCDEFRCRGAERETKADDTGGWSWQTHATWATVYICGLSLFSAHYTFLERYLVPAPTDMIYDSISSSLLSTISKLVSNRDTSIPSVSTQSRPLVTSNTPIKKYSALQLSLLLHIVGWGHYIVYVWMDFIPNIGKPRNVQEFWNYTTNGLACHFSFSSQREDCGQVYIYGWLFLLTYLVYTISSIRFLIMSQSAVFTVAITTTALPLAGIWWSLFHMVPLEKGLIIWAPSVTGELICSLLGLPIVLLGVILLFKSHFKEADDKIIEFDYSSSSTQLA